jgi:hypothetical protein
LATCGEIGQKEEGERVVRYGPVEQRTLVKLAVPFRDPLETKKTLITISTASKKFEKQRKIPLKRYRYRYMLKK